MTVFITVAEPPQLFASHDLSSTSGEEAWPVLEKAFREYGLPDSHLGQSQPALRHKGPPSTTFEDQQRRFDEFRDDFNNVRPHEALDDNTPASHYTPSSRPMPDRIEEPTYPGHFEVRKVSAHGTIRFKNNEVFISHALAGEYVGLEEVDFEIWDIVFYQTSLARYSEKTQRIT